MAVQRICVNLPAEDPSALARFYEEAFGLETRADMGWIVFVAPPDTPGPLQLASGGGSGTDLPAMSLDVDDLDAVLERLRAMGIEPVYGPVTEPWGIRRFYIRDPAGNLVNVAVHV